MLKSSLLCALLLSSLIQGYYAQDETKDPANAYDGWVLVWSDEFNSSKIDDKKWAFESGNNNGWGNNELQYYTNDPSNAFIQDGKLIIQAKKEDKGGFHYTSARMKTQGKYNVTYGRIEASLKLPFGQGLWPAFWMLGENIDKVGWPACGEIDIMEWVGNDPDNVHGSTHGTGFDTTKPIGVNTSATQFHKYTVNWQPDSVEFSVDDKVYATVTPQDTNGQQFTFNNNPMFILLNVAVGGNWPGPPDDSTKFPQQLAVDWVRVYEKKQSGKAVSESTSTNSGKRKCLRRRL